MAKQSDGGDEWADEADGWLYRRMAMCVVQLIEWIDTIWNLIKDLIIKVAEAAWEKLVAVTNAVTNPQHPKN